MTNRVVHILVLLLHVIAIALQSAVSAFTSDYQRGIRQVLGDNSLVIFSSTPTQGIAFSTEHDSRDLLTKEELISRLSAVQEYYKNNPSNFSKIDICLRLLCTRLPNLLLNRCFVSNSTIPLAGNGVFASRDINEGELITLYPGDAVLIDNHKDGVDAVMGVMFGDHINTEDRNIARVTTLSARNYEIGINDSTSIIGDPNIGCSYAAYVGHFINDSSALYSFDDESRKLYLTESLRRCNSMIFVMESSHVGAIATRKIRKGEEVFLSYGEGYWLSRVDTELTPEEERLLMKLKINLAKQYAASTSPMSSLSTVALIEKPKSATKGFKKKSKRISKNGFGVDPHS